ASVKSDRAVRTRSNADLMRVAAQKDAEDIMGDFDGVGIEGVSIERNLPSIILSGEFDYARFSGEQDFILHGRRSNCWRRPSRFQADSGAADSADAEPLRVACQSAAAMAAASTPWSTLCAVVCGRRNISSSHLV